MSFLFSKSRFVQIQSNNFSPIFWPIRTFPIIRAAILAQLLFSRRRTWKMGSSSSLWHPILPLLKAWQASRVPASQCMRRAKEDNENTFLILLTFGPEKVCRQKYFFHRAVVNEMAISHYIYTFELTSKHETLKNKSIFLPILKTPDSIFRHSKVPRFRDSFGFVTIIHRYEN